MQRVIQLIADDGATDACLRNDVQSESWADVTVSVYRRRLPDVVGDETFGVMVTDVARAWQD